MSLKNYEKCLAFTLQYEGGYVNHPKDPGGPTNLGITQGTLSAHLGRKATIQEVKNLTIDDVAPIYKARYWNAVKGNMLPSGLDLVVFDFGVNSGPARSVKALQKLVGVRADGVIGPDTLAAVKQFTDVEALVRKFCAARLAFVKSLRTWKTFGRGWAARISAVEKLGLSMARRAESEPTPVVVVDGSSKKARDEDVSVIKTPDGQAVAVGTVSAMAVALSEATKLIEPLAGGSEILQQIFIVLSLASIGSGLYLKMTRVPD